ncbi:YdhR family protein [Escherichia coli]
MVILLQLHFAFNGPFGDAMAEQLKPLAESINQEPAFCGRYGQKVKRTTKPVDLSFTDEKSALAYLENRRPLLKISALRKLSPKFSMSMSHQTEIHQAKLA